MDGKANLKLFTIPNLITCGNVLCGSVGVVFVSQGKLELAFWMICLASLLDFLDGMVARLLKSYSDIGKELDSLADMLSFGFLPGYMTYAMLSQASTYEWLPYFGFLITVFSALRLAKFNIDTRQSDSFIGLPTPANALFFGSLAMPLQYLNLLKNSSEFLVSLVIIFSYLLVSELPLFSLKFKNLQWTQNQLRWIFLAVSIGLLAVLWWEALPIVIIIYLLLSFVGRTSDK